MDNLSDTGVYLFRLWSPETGGPVLAVLRSGVLIDITNRQAPLVSDICGMADPVTYLREAEGPALGRLADVAATAPDPSVLHLLAPCDLQAIKAAGVTYAGSMIERVIEERAGGDAGKANAIRRRIETALRGNIHGIEPGSPMARDAKAALIKEGLWSQYLEVGIGPDAEVFTKAQPMSSVGHNAVVGVHPASDWNNPEPELVLVVSPRGRIVAASLGNDVNLRDFEGRSALLLSKAKDNNAACAIGPALRFFDERFSLEDAMRGTLVLQINGEDGFLLKDTCNLSEISRSPAQLVAQTTGAHHQYPDGFLLFLGTPFAPVMDRDAPGLGFTHHDGDRVRIGMDGLGVLENTVARSDACPPWTFGLRALFDNLAHRNLT